MSMKKIFTLIVALTLSVGLWGSTTIWHWQGSHVINSDNPFKIDASVFDSAKAGYLIDVQFTTNDDTNDAIEFKANGQKLPGTRFYLVQDWHQSFQYYMTQDAVDSCKVHGMEICGNNFTLTFVNLVDNYKKMKEGRAIWTGFFWVDSNLGTLEVFKEALTAVKDWSKYSAMRFYSEKYPTTDYSIYLLADESKAGEIAESEPATDETAETNPLKRYEGYAELDLTRCNPLTVINNVASDRLMIRMKKQGSAEFQLTEVVLVPVPKYTEYENWQIKLKQEGSEWQNMIKVGEGLFKLANINWTGSGFYVKSVKSDENPIKKEWYGAYGDNDPDVFLGEEVIPPIDGIDVFLRVIDDEHLRIGVGVEPPASGPTVDKTGITVNGRKYGFPVRLVTEVK